MKPAENENPPVGFLTSVARLSALVDFWDFARDQTGSPDPQPVFDFSLVLQPRLALRPGKDRYYDIRLVLSVHQHGRSAIINILVYALARSSKTYVARFQLVGQVTSYVNEAALARN